jgi:hypothetical protein
MKRGFFVVAGFAFASAALAQADYPGARWMAADSSNFTTATRPTSHPVQYIVIHVTQGSYNGSISWFQNPSSNVSAHYIFRSSDGHLTQMVREKDIGWHAGNSTYNQRSIGIEHEGFVNNPAWFTTAMYKASADLTRYATRKYNIERTRTRIIGHVEVPGATHTDPGANWNWNYYMDLVRLDSTFGNSTIPAVLMPAQSMDVVVRFNNSGDMTWSRSGNNPVLLGTQSPQDRTSPFFTSGSWVSGNRAALVSADTVANGVGEFRFRLTAPRNYGTYNESFQLVREGTAWFGPIINFQISVVPGERIVDNVESGFAVKGTWSTGTTAAGRYGADYRFIQTAPDKAQYAQWYLNAPKTGTYDVMVWYPQGTNRSDQAEFIIESATGPVTVKVNQQMNGGRWVTLRRVKLYAGGGFLRLTGNAPSGFVVMADAARIVGPY